MSTLIRPTAAVLGCLALGSASTGCLRDNQERAQRDLEVGAAAAAGLSVVVADGLAHVRGIEPGRDGEPGELRLRASAPDLRVSLMPEPAAAREWIVTVANCMPDAVLTATASDPAVTLPVVELPAGQQPTLRRWRVDLSALAARPDPELAEAVLRIAPPDADSGEPGEMWRFAVMGDIQEAMGDVDEVFARINLEPTLRFVVSTGDIVDYGREDEYDLFERQLEGLAIPYYSTIGNHELFSDPDRWWQRYGRFNVHFRFKNVVFSLIDSGSASIDPVVYDWLDGWLAAAQDRVHMFFTHYPPLDPVGVRSGSFRSRMEASKLLQLLARGNVDVTFYGHIHSYYTFSNAGIPAYISGGGGALPERWDGIGRHFLVVDVSADRVHDVALVRVD